MKTITSPDLDRLQAAADEASALLKALANRERLLLLCQLSQGEFCVGDLAERTGIRQPTLSQQLTVLRNENLVETRRDGRAIYYRIASAPALAVLSALYEQYCAREAS